MAVTVFDADLYVADYVIDSTDWDALDTAQKQRMINVALRELTNKYPKYTIPDNAVYEYAAALSLAFNDVGKLRQDGVKKFEATGISYEFDGSKLSRSLSAYIPQASIDMIAKENDVTISPRGIGWMTL